MSLVFLLCFLKTWVLTEDMGLILILFSNSFDDCFEQNDSLYMQEKMLYHKVWWSSQNEALSLGLKLMKHFLKFCMPQAG